ncbi:MAG: STAS domain-containing protein [Spirochaetes bacterium]|nr:STAS domain-containing protein [Spirochaetota bacterium]
MNKLTQAGYKTAYIGKTNTIMEINISIKEKYAIIEPREEITLFNNMEFKNHLSNIIENTQLNIIIDLTHIREANSIFISTLLFGLRKLTVLGREFGLINVSEEIYNILKLANILNKFQIFNSYEDLL